MHGQVRHSSGFRRILSGGRREQPVGRIVGEILGGISRIGGGPGRRVGVRSVRRREQMGEGAGCVTEEATVTTASASAAARPGGGAPGSQVLSDIPREGDSHSDRHEYELNELDEQSMQWAGEDQ